MNLRFLAVGILAVGLDFLVYSLGFNRLGPEISKAAGFISGATLAFALNRSFTFSHLGPISQAVSKFVPLYLGSLALNVAATSLTLMLAQGWSLGPQFAFAIATVLSTILNYFGQRFWVFRKAEE